MSLEMSFYPTFRNQGQQLQNLLGDLPEGLKTLIGGADYASPTGYLNSRVFYLLMPMILTILASTLGGSLLAREESDGTLEQLLARPVSRGQVITAKFSAMVTILLIATSAATGCIVLLAHVTNMAIADGVIVNTSLAAFGFALSIGSIAFVLTAAGTYARSAAVAIASFIGLGGYVISSLAVQISWLAWPSRLFPFHYYQPEVMLRGDASLGSFLAPTLVCLVCFVCAHLTFRRRDLSS